MKTSHLLHSVFLILVLIGLLSTYAYAANGDGNGDGSNPLTLESCSPANGASDLSTDAAIVMNFSKNVANLLVREQNKTCFSVTDSSGKALDIVVEIGDDQVDREIRHTITVLPASQWPAGETLTLTVSANLSSKSGVTLEAPITLTFKTAGAAANDPPPTTSAPASSSPVQGDATPPSTPGSESAAAPDPSPDAADPAQEQDPPDDDSAILEDASDPNAGDDIAKVDDPLPNGAETAADGEKIPVVPILLICIILAAVLFVSIRYLRKK